MKIQFKILLLSLCSCNLIDPPTHVSPDLQDYVDIVKYEAQIRGVNIEPIKIIIGDLDGERSGRYEPLPPWDRKIIIDRQLFNEGDSLLILKTVAHEIGHSIGRGHKNKEKNGEPISLMCQSCWVDLEENSEYYFDELFQ